VDAWTSQTAKLLPFEEATAASAKSFAAVRL